MRLLFADILGAEDSGICLRLRKLRLQEPLLLTVLISQLTQPLGLSPAKLFQSSMFVF